MKSVDMPSVGIGYDEVECRELNAASRGLTKREQACITLGLPETGDEELDALIRKSERKRVAAKLMAAWVSHHGESGEYKYNSGQAAINSVLDADALLKELEK